MVSAPSSAVLYFMFIGSNFVLYCTGYSVLFEIYLEKKIGKGEYLCIPKELKMY